MQLCDLGVFSKDLSSREDLALTGAWTGGRTSAVTMLPLSTIQGEDTDQVKTTPPEKGALPLDNSDEPANNTSNKEGKMSAKLLPICPLPTVCFAYYLETDDSDSDSQSLPEPLKPDSDCTSPSKPGAEYEEIQTWECPLCCLSVLCLS
ncbi:hypothetical protein Cadr_000012312 [Camelus dromedarius]|uniref:Uncharacterized protein n=1 Tax=Camelus dromedarius TaxID=9838 RepID=A0A5N4DTQ7_CAMDR|nr:hypothetical protein Cadr_000012312 [Camelus dromedarius]